MGKSVCDKECAAKNNSVKCKDCDETFHMKCAPVGSPQDWLKLEDKDKVSWKYDGCETDKKDGDTSVMEAIKKLEKNLSDKMDSRFNSFERPISYINTNFSNIHTVMDAVKTELSSIRSDHTDLIKEHKRLSEILGQAQCELEELQQRSRVNNIEVSCISRTAGKEVYGEHNMGYVKEVEDSKLVYESEIESHEAHSSHWWDLKGSMRPLHAMNKLRLPLIKDGLVATGRISEGQATKDAFLEGLRILDVGCGGGILCEALAQAGGIVTGVDPSEELITVARRHASGLSVMPPTYVCDTIEHHSAQYPALYDVVIASEVVEHVPNPDSFLKGCVAALKPGGSLFTTTPNRTALSWFGAIFICENVLRIVPSGFHSWRQFIHHPDLVAMIRNMGCNVRKVRGMFYDPLRNKWSWCFSTTFMYAVHSVKAH